MLVPALSFISILFTALAMATAAAHAFELPNKMRLSESEYLTAQRLYRGWALLGVFEIIAFVSSLLLLFVMRDNPAAFVPSLLAAIFLLAMQAVFWIFTFPVNRQTHSWTTAPSNWIELRNQWEYSHATRAGLSAAALVALILTVVNS